MLTPAPPAGERRELERVLTSESFRNSAGLRRLLEYLGEHALGECPDELKEYRIGVEGLGKSSTYDPRVDPSVRVQVGRLRSRLAEYYLDEGRDDPLLISLPKGGFRVNFTQRPPSPIVFNETSNTLAAQLRRTKVLALALAAAAAVFLAIALFALGYAKRTSTAAKSDVSPAFLELWRPYFNSNRPIMISMGIPMSIHFVYETPSGRELGGTLRDTKLNTWPEENRPDDSDLLGVFEDRIPLKLAEPSYRYMAVGESLATFLIGKAFAGAGRDSSVVRSNVFSWDSVKAANVIFVGAAKFTPHLRRVQFSRNFQIGSTHVLNLHPKPGELSAYPNVPTTGHERGAALIGRYPNPGGVGVVTVIGSANSRCTWAAAEFLTRPEYVNRLTKDLRTAYGEVPRYFEIVIDAKFDRDSPVEIHNVAHRRLSEPGAEPNPVSH